MPDYRCPSCRGGFPAAAATDDACPWCGESMDGSDDRPLTPGATTTAPASPIAPTIGQGLAKSDLFDDRDLPDELGQRRMERASDRLDDGGDQ